MSKKKKSNTTTKRTKPWVSIAGTVRHLGKPASYYRVYFKDVDGEVAVLDISRKLFGGQTKAVDTLLDAGAAMPANRKAQKALVEEAVEEKGTASLSVTDRVGWNGASFVYFETTYGPGEMNLRLAANSNRNEALGMRSGTLEGWRRGLQAACDVSDHIVAAICIAASGPLYYLIPGTEPAIYHFHGAKKAIGETGNVKSSSGKTLSARSGQSMFGRCADTDLFGFNMTRNALEETCFSCNDLMVVLDEDGTVGEAGGGAIPPQALPYMIVGGKGRRRAAHYSNANGLSPTTWKVPVITTSEDELDSPTRKRKEGASVRMVAIPFPATSAGGTFAAAANKKIRRDLAGQVENTIANHYGVAMPAYLERLVADRESVVSVVTAATERFLSEHCSGGDAWEQRYARKFAMLVAASQLLVSWSIAPWSEERGAEAIAALYKQSRSMMVSANQATDKFLERVTFGVRSGKFPRLRKGDETPPGKKVWGVVRTIAGKHRVLVLSTWRFEKLVVPSAAAALVLDELDRRGTLLKGADGGLKRQVLVKALSSKRKRYICILGLVPKNSTNKKA